MATYTVLASESTVQSVAPGQTVDSISTTILASGHGVVATLVLPETWFEDGTGAARLLLFADALDTIITDGKVTGGTPSQTTNPNSGLLVDAVTFTVGYNPAGHAAGQLTRDVTILSSDMGGSGLGFGHLGPTYAQGIIDGVYESLVSLAGSGASSGPVAQ